MMTRHALALLMAALPLAAAQGPDDRYAWFQVEGARLKQDNSPCVKTVPALGLGVGAWYESGWGIELTGVAARLEDAAGLWRSQEGHLDLSVLHSPRSFGAWRPFMRAGLGYSDMETPISLTPNTTQRLNLLAGLGTQVRFGSEGLASLEVRYLRIETTQPRVEIQWVAGVGIRWGLPPAKPTAPPSTSSPVRSAASAPAPRVE